MDVLDCCCWCAGVLYASATRSLQNEKNVFSFSRTWPGYLVAGTENKWLQTSKWRTALTCVHNYCQYNNIKNENTNDGVEGYQWLFAVTKMLNNITLLIAKRG